MSTTLPRPLRHLFSAVLLVLALGHPAAADEPTPLHVDWFALDLDFGGGLILPNADGVVLARARAGYVRVRGSSLWSIGLAAETKDWRDPSFGAAGEVVSLSSGLAAQAAVMSTTNGTPSVEFGFGWAALRLEAQLILDDQTSIAALGFVRIPLGAIAYKLWGEP